MPNLAQPCPILPLHDQSGTVSLFPHFTINLVNVLLELSTLTNWTMPQARKAKLIAEKEWCGEHELQAHPVPKPRGCFIRRKMFSTYTEIFLFLQFNSKCLVVFHFFFSFFICNDVIYSATMTWEERSYVARVPLPTAIVVGPYPPAGIRPWNWGKHCFDTYKYLSP